MITARRLRQTGNNAKIKTAKLRLGYRDIPADVETRQELNQGAEVLNCAFQFRGVENEKSFLAYVVEGPTTTALVRFTLENRELKITKKEVGSDELEKGWLKVKPVIDADGNRILIVGPASEDSTEEQMPLNYWQLRRKALGWLLFSKWTQ